MERIQEVFKDIPNYGGRYQISNYGRVWSVIKSQFVKQHINNDGYCQVRLYFGDGRKKHEMVHRLVALAFLPRENTRLTQVNHKDENKENNYIENLEWCTASYNNSYGKRLERVSNTNKANGKRKKPVLQYDLQGNFVKEYPSAKEAEIENNIARGHVTKVCKDERKSAGGFIWKYKNI